ncbi:MAG: hypothetical protein HQ509_01830 [Candidatus Marinimicrobia bacterium]|nr:hypothetical protein [Candidatus Neomarinimicrobiota bacterium]
MKNKKDIFIIFLLTATIILTTYNTIRINSLTDRLKQTSDSIEKNYNGGQVYITPTEK